MGTSYPQPEKHIDQCTNKELLHLALTETDDENAWEAIRELHTRGSKEIFDNACKLCLSSNAHERCVGADILSQMGTPHPIFHEETVSILLKMLEQEQEPDVLNSIAVALGHRDDPRAIKPLALLKNHPADHVRSGIVFGLLGFEDDLAIQTLIELSTDMDAEVRNWATFGLGSLTETDTPALREALLVRLTDEDAEARGEAMVGLARRRDLRMLDSLLHDLEEGLFSSLLFQAATEICDPHFICPWCICVKLGKKKKGAGFIENWKKRLKNAHRQPLTGSLIPLSARGRWRGRRQHSV
ncbi:hypothetical protein KSB_81020 [Ktedonobacter robiniae]|uniref:HEAT repeat domain-containing protein n=2 Tax=Ktedonobacter robiniae TaxID=2778365 RepID=A0ABQ3V4D4_9CHLR|nr:hypothetical protein KSB_81020 [Ktedonobacter robiniae]